MKKYLIITLFFLTSFSAQAHKFYVSISQINFNEKNKSIEITLKLFTDDLEKSVGDYINQRVKINQADDANQNIAAYILKNFSIYLNGQAQNIQYLGKELENDVSWCFLEIKNITDFSEIKITNKIFTEQFENQKNLIQISAFDKEESTVLSKNSSTYIFNF